MFVRASIHRIGFLDGTADSAAFELAPGLFPDYENAHMNWQASTKLHTHRPANKNRHVWISCGKTTSSHPPGSFHAFSLGRVFLISS
jgi:hypothetical protein